MCTGHRVLMCCAADKPLHATMPEAIIPPIHLPHAPTWRLMSLPSMHLTQATGVPAHSASTMSSLPQYVATLCICPLFYSHWSPPAFVITSCVATSLHMSLAFATQERRSVLWICIAA
jgi:hypothetical protein